MNRLDSNALRMLARSFIAFALLALPAFVSACLPGDPYDYPIRGAYLGVFFAGVMAMTLELFRLRTDSVVLKRRLRLTAFGFGLVLIVSLLLACALSTLRASWQESLPEFSGSSVQKC